MTTPDQALPAPRPSLARHLKEAAVLAVIALGAAGAVWFIAGGWQQLDWLWAAPPGKIAPYKMAIHDDTNAAVDKEIAFLKKRLEKTPDSFLDQNELAAAYMRKARVMTDPGYFLLAEQAARKSLQLFPKPNTEAELTLVRVDIARHNFPHALKEILRLFKENPNKPGVYATMATLHLAMGDNGLAYKAAFAVASNLPSMDAYTQLGLVHLAAGRDDMAKEALTRGLGLEQPGEREASANARIALGRVAMRRGHLDDAADLFGEALRIRPAHPVASIWRGQVALRQGRPDEAARYFQAAYDKHGQANALVGLAWAATAKQDAAGADAKYEEAAKILRHEMSSGDMGHRRDLARLLLERGKPTEIEQAMQFATDELAMRHDTETVDTAAWGWSANGQPTKALTALGIPLKTGAFGVETLALAKSACLQLKDVKRAEAYGAQLAALDPTWEQDPRAAAIARLAAVARVPADGAPVPALPVPDAIPAATPQPSTAPSGPAAAPSAAASKQP